jgi:signal peptidase I
MTDESGTAVPAPPEGGQPPPAVPVEGLPTGGPMPPPAVPVEGPPLKGRGAHRTSSVWDRYVQRRKLKKQAKAQKPHRKAPWWELPALVVLAILIAILVKTFVVQPFYIPSESMEKTLLGSNGHHDRILVNKIIYDFRDPHPGDIVVFHAPPGWDDEPTSKPPSNPILRLIRGFGQLIGFVPPDGQVLVKRVIAVGGETVWGDSSGAVHIREKNGSEHVLDETYVYEDAPDPRATFGPVVVPKGRLWVMGDHRNNSADSRYHCGGDGAESTDCNPSTSTVPVDDVIGKAFVIAWPPSRWGTLGTPSTFEDAALAGASDVPGLVSTAVLLPIFALRRRRRRT